MTEPQKNDSLKTIGRNEPCPCGSGKKYKRCCGVSAAPKLTTPTNPARGGLDPSLLENMDPQLLQQFTQAFQRLPKGQIQRMQALMQKAMSGKDITTEAAEFERTLPPDFQQLMQSMTFSVAAQMGQSESSIPAEIPSDDNMTLEKAREIVARAAAEGAISTDQARSLLENKNENQVIDLSEKSGVSETSELKDAQNKEKNKDSSSKFSKIWKSIGGKKEV